MFDDISLSNKPQLQFSCKYPREVKINLNLTVGSPTPAEEDIAHSGHLEYEATVEDVKIGRDSFTEVLITPKHNLSNIFANISNIFASHSVKKYEEGGFYLGAKSFKILRFFKSSHLINF